MLECMKPVSPGPSLSISYRAPIGQRKESLPLPVVVTSFNEPLSMEAADFAARWQALGAPGLEEVEVLSPTVPINPTVIAGALTSV